MKKKSIVTLWIIFTLLLMGGVCHDETSFAANSKGVVTASSLNVRTGAGTDYAKVKYNGKEVAIPKGTEVTIIENLSGWYKVTFAWEKTTLTGYVSATYVAIEVSATPTPAPTPEVTVTYRTETTYKAIHVPAKTLKKAPVYKSDGKTRYSISKKKISLEKGTEVKIIGEKTIGEKKWFQLSFTYGKKTRKAYVRNYYLKMTLKSPANAQTKTGSLKVRTKKGTKSPYRKVDGKTIALAEKTVVSITKDVLWSKSRWYKISFTYNGKSNTGYVNSKYVKLAKKVITKKVPVVAMTDAQFEQMLKTQNFPESYKPYLRTLHDQYPYWQFQAFHTDLEWKTVIKNESKTGVNLISNAKSKAWKSTAADAYDSETGKWKVFDGSSWVAASRKAVSYYMDPRNFLNDRSVFMFELLGYQPQYQLKEGVNTIISNTPFYKKKFNYVDIATGETKSMYYATAFMEAAKQTKVSPYHLASRVKQEVVTSATTTSTAVTGNVSQYPGIYNFYNIGATSSAQPVLNGLKWASNKNAGTYLRPWTDPYRSLVGGAMYISQGYISKGQNTGYLEKFNVTSYERYNHQYMTNVEAAYEEALKTKKAYAGMMDRSPLVFSIPVYKNMPKECCEMPQ